MAGTVTIGGTVTSITTTPTDEGGGATHFDSMGGTERDARNGISNDSEGVQEVTLFIAELVEAYSFPSGNACIDWLMQVLQAMRQQPLNGSDRSYGD